MSDLVERLRAWHTPNETITGDVQLYLDAADRIEALEFELKAAKSETEIADSVIEQKQARIEALETALREIAGQMLIDEHDEDYNGDYEAGYEAIVRIARAALVPEQDKCIHSWSAPFDGMVKCTKCGSALAPEHKP